MGIETNSAYSYNRQSLVLKARDLNTDNDKVQFANLLASKLKSPHIESSISYLIGENNRKKIKLEHEQNPNKLSEDVLVREMQEFLYSKLNIFPEANKNDTKSKFLKGVIDGLLVGNAELAREVYVTNGRVILEMLKTLLSLEGLKKVAQGLETSIMDLFSGDSYKVGKSIAELGLITTGGGVVGWGLKNTGKTLMREGAKMAVKSGEKTIISQAVIGIGKGTEMTGKIAQVPYKSVKKVTELSVKGIKTGAKGSVDISGIAIKKGSEAIFEKAPKLKAVSIKVKNNVAIIVSGASLLIPNTTNLKNAIASQAQAIGLGKAESNTLMFKDAKSQIASELKDFPEMSSVVEKFLADKDHPTNLRNYLLNPRTRSAAILTIHEIASSGNISEAEFQALIKSSLSSKNGLMNSMDSEFSLFKGQKKSDMYSQFLKEDKPTLFSIGEKPTLMQNILLSFYAKKLGTEGISNLKATMDKIVGEKNGLFLETNVRAKSASGMKDKIARMRKGNNGKNPRPDYDLSKMPDALGGRITVSDIHELERITANLEDYFGKKNILERDNFYVNEKKTMKPYRIITYTVVLDNGMHAEIQLSTLMSSIAADIDHNTIYKPYILTTSNEKEMIKSFNRKATAIETKKLQ